MGANTPSIQTAIKTMAQGLQINSAPAYATVKVGALKDLTDALPILEITSSEDNTERASMNQIGQQVLIADEQVFTLTSIVDFTNSETAEATLATLRDALTQMFQSSAHLNDTTGVIGVWLSNGKYGYIFRNGQWYRMHQIKLTVRLDYEITVQN